MGIPANDDPYGKLNPVSRSFESKIVSRAELIAAVAHARTQGKTVVQCHGCFDIVHPGHLRYLEFAREQGDVLIVTINSDTADQADSRSFTPQEVRAENLAALMFVDHVHIIAEPTAQQVLAAIKPDVYVKGREFEHSRAPAFAAERSVVESYGGRIIFSSGEIAFNAAPFLEHLTGAETESHRLKLICRRHELTADTLTAVVERFRNLHVLVVGDVVIDRYVHCDPLGVASESPVISLAHREERTYVGGAAIVARHIAALGAHAFLLSAGANDGPSRMVGEILTAEGVESHLIPLRPALVEKTRFLADDQKLFKLDRAQCLPLDSVAERRAALILEQQSRVADAVIFCDFGYGMITAGLLGRVLPTLRHNIPIITADVSGGRGNLLNFHHVDLLCPTELEIRAMLNDYEAGLSAVAWKLLDKTQARHLFITMEKRGLVTFDRASQQRGTPEWSGRLMSEALPSFGLLPVDKLGCGDALLAAATLALAADAPLIQAAYLGNAAAAIELSMLGNHPVDAGKLRAWIAARRELSNRSQPKAASIRSEVANDVSISHTTSVRCSADPCGNAVN